MSLRRSLRGSLRGGPKISERTPCIGEVVTEWTSQSSPGTLSEPLSEPHFLLSELQVLLPLIVLPLETSAIQYWAPPISEICPEGAAKQKEIYKGKNSGHSALEVLSSVGRTPKGSSGSTAF